jgi:hypothetical protein
MIELCHIISVTGLQFSNAFVALRLINGFHFSFDSNVSLSLILPSSLVDVPGLEE